MIYFAGVLESVLTIDSDNLSLAPGGKLWENATLVRREVDPRVAVLTRLSNDGAGRLLMESLVRERIVFDPMLVSSNQPSFLVTEDRAGRRSLYSAGTSAVSATSDELLESLRSNSDVDIVAITGSGLYYQPLFSSILDASTFCEMKPRIILDVASSSYEHGDNTRLARQITQALEWAAAIILEPSDLPLFEGKDIGSLASCVYLVDGDDVKCWVDGVEGSFVGGRAEVYRRIIGA